MTPCHDDDDDETHPTRPIIHDTKSSDPIYVVTKHQYYEEKWNPPEMAIVAWVEVGIPWIGMLILGDCPWCLSQWLF